MKTSKTAAAQPARIASRPIADAAYRAAMELRSARRSYARDLADIHERLNRASKDVADSATYGDTFGHQAGNIVQTISRLADNMRLDLLVKYAAAIDANTAVLAAIRDQLTDEERALLAQYEAIER